LVYCFDCEEIAMEWQEVITWLAIAMAGVYVFWRGGRIWRGMRGGCSGGCGCAKAPSEGQVKTHPAIIAREELVLRRRPPRGGE
jgi:hypothetical protein